MKISKGIVWLLAGLFLVAASVASVFWLHRPDYYCHRGITKEAKSNWDGAIADFNKAIELNPNDAQAYLYLHGEISCQTRISKDRQKFKLGQRRGLRTI